MKGSVIHWFRKGLRVHDNPALTDAIKVASASGKVLRPVYIFDPWYKKHKKICKYRYRFIIESLHDLDASLRKLGSRLFVFQGSPKEILKKYFKKWKTIFITWEEDIEPYAVQRDDEIYQLASLYNIGVSTHRTHKLYEADTIIKNNNGDLLLIFEEFYNLLFSLDPPPLPDPAVTELPKVCILSFEEIASRDHGIPTVTDMVGEDDFKALQPTGHPGGETEGLQRLDDVVSDGCKLVYFQPSSSDLSVYLAFGCVSPRQLYWGLKAGYQIVGPQRNPPPLFTELISREFYYCIASVTENFDKMKNNRVCRQIDWDTDPSKIQAWTEGKTGYPFIDAVMTQLKTEGWIDAQCRNVVGCFLTRGNLWQLWEVGKRVFEEHLIDVDWALNAGNWMWLSASAFSYEYFQTYSPVDYGKTLDPLGEYVKKYLPLLKDFPPEYIYQPWEAPISVQEAAGCLLGKDYPKPIVNNFKSLIENMKKMKDTYIKVFSMNANKRKTNTDETPTEMESVLGMKRPCIDIPDDKHAVSIKVECPDEGSETLLGDNEDICKRSVIHWFRKGLRLHDNPALIDALMVAKTNSCVLRPVYIFDSRYTSQKSCIHRYRFVIESLHDLDNSLHELGSRLFVFQGSPKDVFKEVFRTWKTSFITWEEDLDPYSIKQDEEICQLALSLRIGVSTHDTHKLYQADTLMKENRGKLPMIYQEFFHILSKMDPPTSLVPAPIEIPEVCMVSSEEMISEALRIPTVTDLIGVKEEKRDQYNYPGGESEGLRRLDEELQYNFYKTSYLLTSSPTDLGPYLSFGCVSPRAVYFKIHEVYFGVRPKHLPTLYAELVSREFFYCIASATENFDKMEGNSICRQVKWDDDPLKFEAWSNATTGFPLVDAIMTQLMTDGWISYQFRNVVGCFLTRSYLWQSWEVGKRYFEECLFDVDWVLNAGNWMWMSCSAFCFNFNQIYEPVGFGKVMDPSGEYIKKYLPRLSAFPPEYIYQPWESPIDIQQAAGCIIGEDYPKPIINHQTSLKENMRRMRDTFGYTSRAMRKNMWDLRFKWQKGTVEDKQFNWARGTTDSGARAENMMDGPHDGPHDSAEETSENVYIVKDEYGIDSEDEQSLTKAYLDFCSSINEGGTTTATENECAITIVEGESTTARESVPVGGTNEGNGGSGNISDTTSKNMTINGPEKVPVIKKTGQPISNTDTIKDKESRVIDMTKTIGKMKNEEKICSIINKKESWEMTETNNNVYKCDDNNSTDNRQYGVGKEPDDGN